MERASGQVIVETLGGQDLNLDGSVINLAIVGSSRFYDFEIFESVLEEWISEHTYPDLIIVGGDDGSGTPPHRPADPPAADAAPPYG